VSLNAYWRAGRGGRCEYRRTSDARAYVQFL
jgi:hypothetical protein